MSPATDHLLTALAALGRMAAANEIGMVTSTPDGVRDANDAFLRLPGYTRADLEAGRVHWRVLTAPEWTSLDDSALDELRATGSYGPNLKEYRRSDGTRLTVEVTGVLVSHEPLSWVTFVRDPAAQPAFTDAVAGYRLQLLLRYTALGGAGPASVLDALDRACPDLTGTDLATVAYAEYEPAGPDGPTLTYACAGHPPPLLADGGTVRFLDGGRSRALGFRGPRTQARITVPLQSRLVLYTDGLIERRRQPLDTGFERLARAVGELPAGDPRASCERLLSVMTGGHSLADDIAAACIDLTGPGEGS